MTFKEQITGILKATPYLPSQALTGISMLILIPILIVQAYNNAITEWEQTTANVKSFIDIQERIRNGEIEYFYQIEYEYIVNGQQLNFRIDHGSNTKASAINNFNWSKKYPNKQIWFDVDNPKKYEFENMENEWVTYLFLLIIPILVIAYMKWLLIKYYELELKK